jgi:hypothetical protein
MQVSIIVDDSVSAAAKKEPRDCGIVILDQKRKNLP